VHAYGSASFAVIDEHVPVRGPAGKPADCPNRVGAGYLSRRRVLVAVFRQGLGDECSQALLPHLLSQLLHGV